MNYSYNCNYGCPFNNNKYNIHIMIAVFTEVPVVEKSYRYWNKLITRRIGFTCDGSEPSGQGQKDVLVM